MRIQALWLSIKTTPMVIALLNRGQVHSHYASNNNECCVNMGSARESNYILRQSYRCKSIKVLLLCQQLILLSEFMARENLLKSRP